jgi:hypothetical protein
MALWCEKIPVVHVPQGHMPKPVTFIYPYYRNTHFLRQHIQWWHTFPAWLKAELNAIIVDDGSPEPAVEAIQGMPFPFPIRLFRIQQDVRWNWLAARNIGFRHASDGWCLVTDMDHVIPETTATAAVFGKHDPKVIYGFSRKEYSGVTVAPHPNSWLMTREMFWRVGGYDEALSGHYGTDGDWRRRCAATAPMQILPDRLIRHEYQQDSSTTAYLRKQPEDAAVKKIIATRGKGWRPKVLSFPYDEIVIEDKTRLFGGLIKESTCL